MPSAVTLRIALACLLVVCACAQAGGQTPAVDPPRTPPDSVVPDSAPESEADSHVSAEGWTTFTRSADTRAVYVSSSSGDDARDGLSEAGAKRTLAAAKALLRHGRPDWLLLRRGDVWQESLGQWKTSGRSAREPQLVSGYGDAAARPLLRTGTEGGVWTHGGGGSPATIDNLAIVGLHFSAAVGAAAEGGGSGERPTGAMLLRPGAHVLIEDCMFAGYGTNLVFQGYEGRHTDFKLRRSVIVDAYAVHGSGAHPQGLYAYAVDGLLLEENVFDHNGWSETVPDAGADIYSHNVYIDNDNTGVVVRGNIIANAASHGMQLRPGGEALDNLFVRNSIALSVGGGNNPEPDGVTAEVRRNVVLGGKDIDAATPRGWGLWFGNIASGHVTENLITKNLLGTAPLALQIVGNCRGESRDCIGVYRLVVEGNVISDWGGPIRIEGDARQLGQITLARNDIRERVGRGVLIEHVDPASLASVHWSGNRLGSLHAPADAWVRIGRSTCSLASWRRQVDDLSPDADFLTPSDPDRDLATYVRTLDATDDATDGATDGEAAFFAGIRAQSKATWRPEYTAAAVNRYLRAGHGLVTR